MRQIKEGLRNFMRGRYGMDELSKTLLITAFISAVLSVFLGRVFYTVSLLLVLFVYLRMLSTNYEKRYKENLAYVDLKNRIQEKIKREKRIWQQKKTHHIFICPQCKQKIRIPKGHGKVVVTCPKCKFEFQRRS